MNDNEKSEMLNYVSECLSKSHYRRLTMRESVSFDRFEHIKRVCVWVDRLIKGNKKNKALNLEALQIAAIFHDAGYGRNGDYTYHAHDSALILRDYLCSHNYNLELTDYACYLVENHSNKGLLDKEETQMELIILIEADMLDDTGAQAIVMDALIEGKRNDPSFEDVYKHLIRYSCELMKNNPLRTKTGRRYWADKQKLVKEFLRHYELDLGIGEDKVLKVS